jgi:hypothetical protein
MNINSNLIARLLINELPGLAGALQPLGTAQGTNELARRGNSQNLSNAMLAAASGLLASNPSRYPLGPLQRLGGGLGAALQALSQGTGQEPMADAPGFDNGGYRGGGRGGRPALGGIAGARPRRARSAGIPELQRVESAVSAGHASAAPQRIVRRGTGTAAASGARTLRKFSGTVARRLDHPAVLPGGWQLYGYEESGSPIYVGPDQKLRIYA